MVSEPKSLAAEIEAVTERERTRLIAWLAEHQVSTGAAIDREVTADALMADFIAPRLAEIAALQSRAFEDGARTKVLATGWLKSMGRRDGEDRGPVVEFVIDASQAHAMTFGDIWNGRLHQIATLPLKLEGERNDR